MNKVSVRRYPEAYQIGRHRWVEYKDLEGGWSTYNAASVPPEWHGWLNHADDKPGLVVGGRHGCCANHGFSRFTSRG